MQFQCLRPRDRAKEFDNRRTNMAQLLQVLERDVHEKSFRVKRRLGLYLEQVFDQVNDVIGETWYWSTDYFYFARESDAVWFAMRFL